MKRFLSLLAVGILVLSGLGAVNTSGEEIKQEKTTLSFSRLLINEKDEHIIVEIEGANLDLLEKDHYIVPTKIETFMFPFGTEIIDVKCVPKDIHVQQLTKEIKTAPEPVLTSQLNLDTNNIQSEKPKSVDTWYDYSIGCGLNGQERNVILKVQVFPIQYHPLENSLEWAESIEIKIDYNEPLQSTMSFDDEYDLIVLTPSEYSDELSSLITHKNNRGLTTKLVTLNEIYGGTYFPANGRDNPEKIKYFIKNTIENWNTRFVLLVGGDNYFPTRETHVYVDYGNGDDELFASDLYYADIYDGEEGFSSWDTNENDVFGEYDWDGETDDVDLYPDIYLGRLACTSGSQVTSSVNKIITYETNEAYTQDWFTKIVVIGGDTSPNDDEDINEGEYVNQAILDIMDGFIPTKCWASEGTLSTRTHLNNAINSGAGFVDFAGHGNPQLWATHPHNNEDTWIPIGNYKNTNVESLNNGNELPVVITGACSVAKFIDRDDCFTWSFVSNPNGGGIASIGPSALSWGYDTSYVTKALGGKMQTELFKAYREDGALSFGEMWAKGISNYITTRMDGGDHKTLEEWQAFGDPSLAIADESLAPNKPDAPEGSTSGGANVKYTYTASTTDPDGDDLYYLFDWDDGTYSEWVGPKSSGQTASASHSWSAEGDYSIRVKAKDDHGVQSEWSDPLPISMPRNRATYNQLFLQILEKFPNIFPILRTILGVY